MRIDEYSQCFSTYFPSGVRVTCAKFALHIRMSLSILGISKHVEEVASLAKPPSRHSRSPRALRGWLTLDDVHGGPVD